MLKNIDIHNYRAIKGISLENFLILIFLQGLQILVNQLF